MRYHWAAVACLAPLGILGCGQCKCAPTGLELAGTEIRVAPVAARTAAGYLTIWNNSSWDDTLRQVTSAAAAHITLEETMEHDGMSMMTPLAFIVTPAGKSVTLRPGGLHIMLDSLRRPLVPGDSIEMVLRFAVNGDQRLAFVVKPVGD